LGRVIVRDDWKIWYRHWHHQHTKI
jgi:hypothetical protein